MTDRHDGAPGARGDEPFDQPGEPEEWEPEAGAPASEASDASEPPDADTDADSDRESDADLIEGELVEPSTAEAAEADALLAEALDAESIEAQFLEAEEEARVAAESEVSHGQVAALTADLQRVHAEYSNYRKRVERDRELVRQRAVEGALVELLPVLDDIGRAREHNELVGAFKAVGEALEAVVAKLGMSAFGEPGEAFDPHRHEALMRQSVEGVSEPTVVAVFQAGYEMNGRVVRPARVAVAGTD